MSEGALLIMNPAGIEHRRIVRSIVKTQEANLSPARGRSRHAAVPLNASALRAGPHRYVGGFQGLVHGFGQVIPD